MACDAWQAIIGDFRLKRGFAAWKQAVRAPRSVRKRFREDVDNVAPHAAAQLEDVLSGERRRHVLAER